MTLHVWKYVEGSDQPYMHGYTYRSYVCSVCGLKQNTYYVKDVVMPSEPDQDSVVI